MAVKSSLKPLLRDIAGVIGDYVRHEGVSRDEVALLGSWNERTDRIGLLLVTTRHAMVRDMSRWYAEILDKLRQALDSVGEVPATWNIGLVLRWTADIRRDIERYSAPDDEEDISEILNTELTSHWPR